jgi:hypothetical protein
MLTLLGLLSVNCPAGWLVVDWCGGKVVAALRRRGHAVASIQQRTTKRDGTHLRVRWQEGGRRDGRWDSETFFSSADAKRFKSLVDINGNRRPDVAQLREYGFEGLIPHPPNQVVVAVESASAVISGGTAPSAVPTFTECAAEYIDDLDHALGYTKRRYRADLANHVASYFGGCLIDQVEYDAFARWQRELVKKGLSRKTIAKIRGTVVIPVLEACVPAARAPAGVVGGESGGGVAVAAGPLEANGT